MSKLYAGQMDCEYVEDESVLIHCITNLVMPSSLIIIPQYITKMFGLSESIRSDGHGPLYGFSYSYIPLYQIMKKNDCDFQ